MATSSGILTWKIPWTEKPGGLQSKGPQKSQTQLSAQARTHTHTPSMSYVTIWMKITENMQNERSWAQEHLLIYFM